jgi:phosphoglycolate phosphatase
MLKAVLFDLDGTLLDTAPDFIFCLNCLLAEENMEPLSDKLIRNTVSNGASALIHLGFPHTLDNEAELTRLRNRLLEIYAQHLADHTLPFDGITDLLVFLEKQAIPWGIVTNKPYIYTKPLVEKMDFPVIPGCIVCPEHVSNRKPHPEPLQLACKQLACSTNEAIYLGDHSRDIEAGLNADMPTIACSYGYIEAHDSAEKWNARHIINQPLDALPILKNYLSNESR